MAKHQVWHSAVRSVSAKNMTFDDWKPIIRSAIAAFCGLILMLDSRTIKVLGQASFLVLVVSSASPPAFPTIKVFYEAVYSMLFVCSSWLWYVIASRAAIAARSNVYNIASLSIPGVTGFNCGSSPSACFSQAIFDGNFIEAGSSLVFAFMLYLGACAYLYIKVTYPARLLSVIFGLISLIIPFSYGPLFPYWYPTLGQLIAIPIGSQLAIGLVASMLFWPESMNHAYIKQIQGLLGTIKSLSRTQGEILASDIDDVEQWKSYANIKDQVRAARTGLSAFKPNEAFLDREMHYSRLNASDLRELTQLCRDICLKLGGFALFYDLVSSHMWTGAYNKAEHSHDAEDEHEEKHSMEHPSHTQSGAGTPATPHSSDDGMSHQHLDQVSEKLRVSSDSRRRKKHKHAHFKKNQSVTDLLHTALHHQYKPVGVFEMHQYTEREQKFPRQAEIDVLRKMMALVATESSSLFAAVIAAIEVNCEYLTIANKDRLYDRLIFRRGAKDMQESLTVARDALSRAWDDFDQVGRLKMVTPYDKLDNTDYFGPIPHRPLLRMFYLEFHIMRFSHAILTLTQKCLDLEINKKHPTWQWPTAFFFYKFRGHHDQSQAKTTQDEHQLDENAEGGMVHADDYETEVRDPDHEPPRHLGHLLGGYLIKILRVMENPSVFFCIKGSMLLILIALPGFLHRTAGWFYRNRGLWAVIMAAFTQAPYLGDASFTFLWRIIGTFFGALLGAVAWYIGNGSGNGNAYTFGLLMAALLPGLMYIRLKFVYLTPQPAIISILTFALIVGYSWQDTHLPGQVNFGVGWHIAWRRFVVVLIGISAAFLWSFIPKPITGRQVIRRRLALGVFEIGNIYVQVSNFARNPAPTASDEEAIRQMVVRANTKLLVLHQRLLFVSFEPPIAGPWPKDKYLRLWNLQRELLDLMVAFVNNLAHMRGSEWRCAMLRRTGWYDRALIGDCLAVLFMTANAIRTGGALPQLVPCPLLQRFSNRLNKIQESRAEGSLPQIMSRETLEDPGYASFAVGSVISFAIVVRVDEMMAVTKELVGERWQSAHWMTRHEYERLDSV